MTACLHDAATCCMMVYAGFRDKELLLYMARTVDRRTSAAGSGRSALMQRDRADAAGVRPAAAAAVGSSEIHIQGYGTIEEARRAAAALGRSADMNYLDDRY